LVRWWIDRSIEEKTPSDLEDSATSPVRAGEEKEVDRSFVSHVLFMWN